MNLNRQEIGEMIAQSLMGWFAPQIVHPSSNWSSKQDEQRMIRDGHEKDKDAE